MLILNKNTFSQLTPLQHGKSATLKADYIFEGKVIRQTFYESSPGNVFTRNIIQITKIFKGSENLSCGTVMLISNGSSGQWLDFGNGLYNVQAGSHMLEYHSESQGIFFAIENDGIYPDPGPNSTTNLNLTLRTVFPGEGTFIEYNFDPRLFILQDSILKNLNFSAKGFMGMHFGGYNEILKFFTDNIAPEKQNIVNCEASSFEPPFDE